MAWNDLSIPQRSQLMNMFRRNGVVSLSEMKRLYDLSSSPSLVEKPSTAPVYADGGVKSGGDYTKGYRYYPKEEPLTEDMFNGPNPPYGFYDAPLNWDDIEARQHYAESRFHAGAESSVGARGPYQIMPDTWEQYSTRLGLDNIEDYNENKRAKDALMKDLYNSGMAKNGFPSDSVRAAKALASYNWGPGNVDKFLKEEEREGNEVYHSMDWVDRIPKKQTREYVNFVLRRKDGSSDLTNEAFNSALPNRFNEYPEVNRYETGGPEQNWWERFKNIRTTQPATHGVATTIATSGRDIPRVESTVGNDLAYAGATLASPFLLGNASKIMSVLSNPVTAKTGLGAAIATGLDAYGVAQSARSLGSDLEKTIAGNYKASDIPGTLLSSTIMLPGTSALTSINNINAARASMRAGMQGVNNIMKYRELMSDKKAIEDGLKYAQSKYLNNADIIDKNYRMALGQTAEQAVSVGAPRLINRKDVLLKDLPPIYINGPSGFFSHYLGYYSPVEDNIVLNPYNWKYIAKAWKNPEGTAKNLYGTVAHEGTHWALKKLNANGIVKPPTRGNTYYTANEYHPLYKSVTNKFADMSRDLSSYGRKSKQRWMRSPEEFVAELTNLEHQLGVPAGTKYSDIDAEKINKIQNFLGDRFGFTPEETGYIATNMSNFGFANGGKIHIKKKNRGKFTALKKRTGHSASWFKAHGTPAQKKMAVFALNARKWKHAHGGIIF